MEAQIQHRTGLVGKGGARLLGALVLALAFLLATTQIALAAAPVVSGVAPASGPLAGGDNVVLSGSSFIGATSVTFGTTAALFLVNNDGQVTAIAPPAAAAGVVNVRVTTPEGTSVVAVANRYTYVDATAVTGLSPSSGPFGGGTTVTVTGSGFTGTNSVKFGATDAPFVVDSNTQIRTISPASLTAGVVNVRVTSPSGTSPIAMANEFTYLGPAVTVTGLSPSAGPLAGGNTVIISGSGFVGVTSVKFGAQEASFVVNNDTRITAVAPAATAAGDVHVRVSTATNTSAIGDESRYTYNTAGPVVTALNPTSGPLSGGNVVNITGSGFSGATSVTFGGVAASFMVNSPTQITAVAPGAAGQGTVSVRVTTPAGTSTSAANYTYQGPQFCPAGPFWMDDLRYGSPGGGFYWDPMSQQVWTAQRSWHYFSPQPARSDIQPFWTDALTYGSAGGGFYWDSVSGQVWTAQRGWHYFDPQGCIRRA